MKVLKVLDGRNLYENGKSIGPFELTEGQKSEKMTIIERFSGDWCDLKSAELSESQTSLLEASGKKVLLVLEGRFQMGDTKNANGRIYPDSIWARELGESSKTMLRVSKGEMLGELDHPSDGQTMLSRVACMVSELKRSPNNLKEVWGRMVVFNTPEGQKIKAIHEGGGRVGVSSRGQGSVVRTEGIDIVQEDFQLDTWDVVHNPSTPGAFPSVIENTVASPYISETTIKKENEPMSRLAEYQARLERLRERDLSTLPTEAVEVILGEAKDLKENMMKASWKQEESVRASGLIAEVAVFAHNVEEASKKNVSEQTEAVRSQKRNTAKCSTCGKNHPQHKMKSKGDMYGGAKECPSCSSGSNSTKDRVYSHVTTATSRLKTESEVFDYLSEAVILTTEMRLDEAARTARHTLREAFSIEGPLKQHEMAGVTRFVTDSPRQEANVTESALVGTFTSPSGTMADILEGSVGQISGQFDILEAEGDKIKVSFSDPSLKNQFTNLFLGTGAVLEWDDSQRIISECTARFESLIESQVRKTVEAEMIAESTKNGTSELSLKHAAAKQVLEHLANRVRVAEDRSGSRGVRLEASYKLIEALINEVGAEGLRGAVAGIAATHPQIRELGERLAYASDLKDAVYITKRVLNESTPVLDREALGLQENTTRFSSAISLSEQTKNKADRELSERTAPITESVHGVGVLDATLRALNAMPQSR